MHPLSLLFILGSLARSMLFPVVLILLAALTSDAEPDSSRWFSYERILAVMFIPAALFSLIRYWSLRYRFGSGEIVVNEGILNRKERHIPYTRIQNIDITQGVLMRAFGVAEATVETASGTEPEARFKVLSLAAIDDMRQRVFSERHAAAATEGQIAGSDADLSAQGPPVANVTNGESETLAALSDVPSLVREEAPAYAATDNTILSIPTRELTLLGAFSGKGWVAIAALYGAANATIGWERLTQLFEKLPVPSFQGDQAILAVAVTIGISFVALTLLSILFTISTFHGFTLRRDGAELRTQLGLFTRRTSTVPRQRIQILHLERRWWMRLCGRAAIRVETAGGTEGQAAAGRQWLVPIAKLRGLQDVLLEANEQAGVEDLDWQQIHPRTLARCLRVQTALVVAITTTVLLATQSFWALLGLSVLPFSWYATLANLRYRRYAVTDHTIVYRDGWPRRRVSVLPFNKIQAVATTQSPFDRRWRMATLHIDTASAGGITVPYLPPEIAAALRERLQHEAAHTLFRW